MRGRWSDDVLGGSPLVRNPDVAEQLWGLSPVLRGDVVLMASNSGVNGSIVGSAEQVKQDGNPLIAVTSLEHTMRVEPTHPSGKRLGDLADVVIDNLAPYGDATVQLAGGVPVGAVSSITRAFITQLLTTGVAERIGAQGETPLPYLSMNIPVAMPTTTNSKCVTPGGSTAASEPDHPAVNRAARPAAKKRGHALPAECSESPCP